MRNRNIAAAVFAVLLFGCGVATGVLGDRYYTMKVVHARPSADMLRQRYSDDLKRRLHLTPEQVGRLNTVLDQTHDRFKRFRDEHRSEFERINQEQIDAVRNLLTPEQQPEYDKMVAEREQRRKQFGP